MKELIIKIFDVSRNRQIPLDDAIDIIRETDDYSIEDIHKASDLIHKYYNIIVKARQNGDTKILDEIFVSE